MIVAINKATRIVKWTSPINPNVPGSIMEQEIIFAEQQGLEVHSLSETDIMPGDHILPNRTVKRLQSREIKERPLDHIQLLELQKTQIALESLLAKPMLPDGYREVYQEKLDNVNKIL